MIYSFSRKLLLIVPPLGFPFFYLYSDIVFKNKFRKEEFVNENVIGK
jgi:hypothetical protein